MTGLLPFAAGCSIGAVAMLPAAWAFYRREWRAHVGTKAALSVARCEARKADGRAESMRRGLTYANERIVVLQPLAEKGRATAAHRAKQNADRKADRAARRAS